MLWSKAHKRHVKSPKSLVISGPKHGRVIDIRLRHPKLVEESGIDLTKFKRVKVDSDMLDSYYYLSDDSSFAIDAR